MYLLKAAMIWETLKYYCIVHLGLEVDKDYLMRWHFEMLRPRALAQDFVVSRLPSQTTLAKQRRILFFEEVLQN